MHIAFEASSITTRQPTGIAAYARALIEQLQRSGGNANTMTLLNKFSRIRRRHVLYRPAGMPAVFYLPLLSSFVHRFDILHALDATMPVWPGAKRITTIHDVFVLLNQDTELFPPSFIRRKQASYRRIAQRADAIIAVSETTKRDVVERLRYPAERIFVTPLGVDEQFKPCDTSRIGQVREKYRIGSDYLLFVGTITPRKNTQRLVEAFARADCRDDLQLVLCGARNYNSESTLRTIVALGLQNRVVLPDYVAQDDLPALYSGAAGFVYPTLYEGFGIPPLEAMACATPVLTSNVGASKEVCEGAAVLVNPLDVDAIAAGIDALLQHTPQQIERAQHHAAGYSWSRCAELTMQAYRRLLAD